MADLPQISSLHYDMFLQYSLKDQIKILQNELDKKEGGIKLIDLIIYTAICGAYNSFYYLVKTVSMDTIPVIKHALKTANRYCRVETIILGAMELGSVEVALDMVDTTISCASLIPIFKFHNFQELDTSLNFMLKKMGDSEIENLLYPILLDVLKGPQQIFVAEKIFKKVAQFISEAPPSSEFESDESDSDSVDSQYIREQRYDEIAEFLPGFHELASVICKVKDDTYIFEIFDLFSHWDELYEHDLRCYKKLSAKAVNLKLTPENYEASSFNGISCDERSNPMDPIIRYLLEEDSPLEQSLLTHEAMGEGAPDIWFSHASFILTGELNWDILPDQRKMNAMWRTFLCNPDTTPDQLEFVYDRYPELIKLTHTTRLAARAPPETMIYFINHTKPQFFDFYEYFNFNTDRYLASEMQCVLQDFAKKYDLAKRYETDCTDNFTPDYHEMFMVEFPDFKLTDKLVIDFGKTLSPTRFLQIIQEKGFDFPPDIVEKLCAQPNGIINLVKLRKIIPSESLEHVQIYINSHLDQILLPTSVHELNELLKITKSELIATFGNYAVDQIQSVIYTNLVQ
nr:innexin like protein [Abalone asfa-like virus]